MAKIIYLPFRVAPILLILALMFAPVAFGQMLKSGAPSSPSNPTTLPSHIIGAKDQTAINDFGYKVVVLPSGAISIAMKVAINNELQNYDNANQLPTHVYVILGGDSANQGAAQSLYDSSSMAPEIVVPAPSKLFLPKATAQFNNSVTNLQVAVQLAIDSMSLTDQDTWNQAIASMFALIQSQASMSRVKNRLFSVAEFFNPLQNAYAEGTIDGSFNFDQIIESATMGGIAGAAGSGGAAALPGAALAGGVQILKETWDVTGEELIDAGEAFWEWVTSGDAADAIGSGLQHGLDALCDTEIEYFHPCDCDAWWCLGFY